LPRFILPDQPRVEVVPGRYLQERTLPGLTAWRLRQYQAGGPGSVSCAGRIDAALHRRFQRHAAYPPQRMQRHAIQRPNANSHDPAVRTQKPTAKRAPGKPGDGRRSADYEPSWEWPAGIRNTRAEQAQARPTPLRTSRT